MKAVNPVINNDIMRYKKNKAASSLALLGLALGCVYFIVLYAQVRNDNYYYKWSIAADVVYNLVFLLLTFLFSEQVKNYDRKLFWLQLIVGAIQVARIFWLPLGGLAAGAISSGSFIAMAVALGASGACIIVSGIMGFLRSMSVEKFNKQVESGEISVEATLKELDEKDSGNAVKVVSDPVIDEAFNEVKAEENAEEETLPETRQEEEDLPVINTSEEVE